jgi:hypothetical protein
VEEGLQDEWWSPNVLYNLACFYARRATIGTNREDDLAVATRRLTEAIDRAAEPALLRAMAASDPVLAEVQTAMAPPAVEHDYSADVHIGRGWGVRVHEAVKSTVRGDQNGRQPAPDSPAPGLPQGAGNQGQ